MDVVLDRSEYAAAIDEPEHLLEPIPMIAPASDGNVIADFKIGLPCSGGYRATFEIESRHTVVIDGIAVRYGNFRPIVLATREAAWVDRGDFVYLFVRVS